MSLTCLDEMFIRFLNFLIKDFILSQILLNLLRRQLNQHSSNFWSFFWSSNSNYIFIDCWSYLISQVRIVFSDSWNNFLSIIEISLINRHLTERNHWSILNLRSWRLRSRLRHALNWLLRSSLSFVELLLIIPLELLIIVIVSRILTVVSSYIISLVEFVSIIHKLVGLLVGLYDLKKGLQHLGQMRLRSQIIPIKSSFFLRL